MRMCVSPNIKHTKCVLKHLQYSLDSYFSIIPFFKYDLVYNIIDFEREKEEDRALAWAMVFKLVSLPLQSVKSKDFKT